MTILYAAFAGLALALIVYNLSLWAAMRHRFQLVYCAMVAALGAYTFTSSGMLTIAAALDREQRPAADQLSSCWPSQRSTALIFVRSFFEARVIGLCCIGCLRWC